MPGIFGPESESDSEEDLPHINYANYNVGDFIRFKKMSNEPISYGVISEILADTPEGKSYKIIYYDTGRTDDAITSNPTKESVFRENTPLISLGSVDPTPQLRHYDGNFRMLYDVMKILDIEVPEEIREQLLAALNTANGLNTPSVTRSTTGTSYDDNSRSSSSSISRNSSSGGKRYRNKKNKTRRRNKKTKRR